MSSYLIKIIFSSTKYGYCKLNVSSYDFYEQIIFYHENFIFI